MFFRLIIWGFIFYFGYRVYQSFKEISGSTGKKIRTPGKNKSKNRAFDKSDIEEIDYEEIDD
jgi:hypothetical protein